MNAIILAVCEAIFLNTLLIPLSYVINNYIFCAHLEYPFFHVLLSAILCPSNFLRVRALRHSAFQLSASDIDRVSLNTLYTMNYANMIEEKNLKVCLHSQFFFLSLLF